MRARYTAAAVACTLIATACLNDAPSGPETPTVRLNLVAQVGGSGDRSIAIRVFYRRVNQQEPVPLVATPAQVRVAGGTQTQAIVVHAGACLNDPQRVDANRAGCRFSVELQLLGPDGAMISSDAKDAAAPVLPRQTTTFPPFVLPGLGFQVAPTAVTFSAQANTQLPPEATVAISPSAAGQSLGTLTSEVTYTSGSGWLSSRIESAAGNSALILQPTTTQIPPGSYTATVAVISTTAGTRRADVTYTVSAIPQFPLTLNLTGSGSGTVTSSPAGINCVLAGGIQSGSCTGNFDENTLVTLTASPTGGSSALLSGACSGTTSCQVTMDRAQDVSASFTAPPRRLRVSAGSGSSGAGSVTASGIDCTVNGTSTSGDCEESYASGSAVTLTASTAGSSGFGAWTGCTQTTGQTCTVAMNQDRDVTVSFTAPLTHTLTVRAGPNSTGTGTVTASGINCAISGSSATQDCSESYTQGTPVVLTAAATGGSTFAGWGGACAGATGGTCTVTMNQSLDVTASFTAPIPQRRLVVSAGPNSSGTGSVTATGISCTVNGTSTTGDCEESYAQGTSVALTATATGGSTFAGWGGACAGGASPSCTLSMTQDRDVTVSFTAPVPLRALTVSAGSGSTGTGNITGSGISCAISGTSATQDCQESYPDGTSVTLTATTTGGSTFGSWTGCTQATGPSCTVTMNQNRNVTASFNAPPLQRRLTVSAGTGNTGSGTVTSSPAGITCTINGAPPSQDCDQSYPDGTSVTLTATPTGGSSIGVWTGCTQATGLTCFVIMNQDRNVTVTFIAAPLRTLTINIDSDNLGAGMVISQPGPTPAINCVVLWQLKLNSCAQNYPSGTVIDLAAVLVPGMASGRLGGACAGGTTCRLTLDQNRTVVVSFSLAPRAVAVYASPGSTGRGRVVSDSLTLISCDLNGSSQSGSCSGIVPTGRNSITLTAQPIAGTFRGWGGACASFRTEKCTLSVSQQPHFVTADFK